MTLFANYVVFEGGSGLSAVNACRFVIGKPIYLELVYEA